MANTLEPQQPRAEGNFPKSAEKEDIMKYGELNLDQIEAIVDKLGGMEGVQLFLADNSEVVEKNLAISAISEVFRLTVDYSQSLKKMIAAGRYDWTNSDITAKRFPVNGKGVVEFDACYFHFNRDIESEDAVKGIEAAGWSVAKIEHLLSYGKTFPEEQRKYSIVGLGSVGDRGVPCLDEGGTGRCIVLGWWHNGWVSFFCRFLAVREVFAT